MKNAFNPFLEEERKIFALRREEVLYNARYKYYEDECGELHLMQRLVAERPCFNPDRAEQWRRKASNGGENRPADIAAYQLENMSAGMADALDAADAAAAAANTLRAQRRAKARIFDLALCNYDFKYFVTWTLSADKCDRYDYKAIVRNLGQWLDNRVRRSGLKYLIVPELHKDGAVHFHGLTNDAISVVPSDTWVHPDTGRPVKLSTLRRQHIAPADCQPVYNLADWQNGYTTAIELYGERAHSAAYIAKYVTKTAGCIGGRYYLHGGKLREPLYAYADEVLDFDGLAATHPEQMFDIPGNRFYCERIPLTKPFDTFLNVNSESPTGAREGAKAP